MKHKHCELIKAWADGAEIQYQHQNGEWYCSIDNQPSWDLDVNYRIKPKEKVVRWQWFVRLDGERPYLTSGFYNSIDDLRITYPNHTIIGKAEWTRMEFDE